MIRNLLATTLVLALPSFVTAAPVDLTGWIENGFKGNNGAGTWTVQPGNDAVDQSINGQPTVFFKSGNNDQGTALSGTIRKYGSDDDFVGFVLGYQADEFNSASADFWLIDWKQGNQGAASAGLALSHVSGDITSSAANPDFWAHQGVVNEVARGANLGSTGYIQNQTYTFKLTFTSSLIEVYVDNVLEISHSGSFTDGAFGFYNYSQAGVEYAGITSIDLPPPPSDVPVPASLPLIAAGLGALGLVRRRKA